MLVFDYMFYYLYPPRSLSFLPPHCHVQQFQALVHHSFTFILCRRLDVVLMSFFIFHMFQLHYGMLLLKSHLFVFISPQLLVVGCKDSSER